MDEPNDTIEQNKKETEMDKEQVQDEVLKLLGLTKEDIIKVVQKTETEDEEAEEDFDGWTPMS